MRGPIQNFRSHAITAIVAAAMALGVVIALLGGAGALPSFGSTFEVRAIVPNAAALATQSRVTMAGVDVGRVVGVQRQGTGAILRLALDSDHREIPADTRVAVRLRTLVGEKFVELVPGRSRTMLADNGVLPMSQADDFVDVDTVLSQLRGKTKARAQAAIQSLGGGVQGEGGNLNRVVEGFTGLVNKGEPPVGALSRQHEQITRIVANLGQLAQSIGTRGDVMFTLAQRLGQTATAVASRNAAVERIFADAPATLAQVRQTTKVLASTSRDASPVLSDTADAVAGLKPTVTALRPAANQGRSILTELNGAAPRLRRTLDDLQRLSKPATRTLPELGKTLCQLNPLVRRVAPYGKEVAAVFSNLGSAVNAYDANGHIARLYIGVGTNSLFGTVPPAIAKAENTLLTSGIFANFHLLGYNPFPAPGDASGITVGNKATGPADAVNKYERVTADC
jgi:phospholipid/cholesterol/gamma-HCH transport system substrate-binding protein